jgi:hypothetical protein
MCDAVCARVCCCAHCAHDLAHTQTACRRARCRRRSQARAGGLCVRVRTYMCRSTLHTHAHRTLSPPPPAAPRPASSPSAVMLVDIPTCVRACVRMPNDVLRSDDADSTPLPTTSPSTSRSTSSTSTTSTTSSVFHGVSSLIKYFTSTDPMEVRVCAVSPYIVWLCVCVCARCVCALL